jgi:5-methylcytosine-specific restriction endonuclease McrA
MKALKGLSDHDLLGRLNRLVQKEQKLTLEILAHLAEVARRELYLSRGYATLADYCISEMGYGESSAWRRVRVARVIKDIPEVYDLLEKQALTVSAVLQIAKVLTTKNKDNLLPRVSSKSRSEIERVVAEYGLPMTIPDVARPRIVSREVIVETAPTGANSTIAGQAQNIGAPDAGSRALGDGASATIESRPELGEISLHSEGKNNPVSPMTRTVFERMYEVRFAGDEELMELVGWMRTHLSGRFPRGASFAHVFKYALKYVREREDPVERAKRREARKNKPSNNVTKKTAPGRPRTTTRSRHIPQATRDRVWIRDGGRCAYVGSNGKRCGSTHNLHFDHHPIPFARGGPSTPSNLRLLCARHNRLAAEKAFGNGHMKQYRRRE